MTDALRERAEQTPMTKDAAITALVEKWRAKITGTESGVGPISKQIYRKCAQELADTLAALGGTPETGWQPIETAPKDGTRLDLWAKAWLPAFDRFEYRRFADCVWMRGGDNHKPYWLNLDKEWCATHWQPLPAPPTPPSEEQP